MIPDRDFDPCGNYGRHYALLSSVPPTAGLAELRRLVREQAAQLRWERRAREQAIAAAVTAQDEAEGLRECEATLSRIAQMRGTAGELARQVLGGDEEEAA